MEILLFLYMIVTGFGIVRILGELRNIDIRVENLENNSSIDWDLYDD